MSPITAGIIFRPREAVPRLDLILGLLRYLAGWPSIVTAVAAHS